MKLKHRFFFLASSTVFMLLAGASSCGKSKTAPVVAITYPNDTTMITIPDSIYVSGIVTHEAGLHEMSILLVDSVNSDTVVEQYPYVHDSKAYNFRFNYFPSTAGTYVLHVTAHDHDARQATAIRRVVVM